MEGLPGHPVRRPRRLPRGRPHVGRSLTGTGSPRRRVALLRHARTGHNAGGRIQGQLDPPLDDVGREQARAVAGLLAAARPAVLLSSDLSRARDTAAAITAAGSGPLQLDPRLRELHLGRWQGLTLEQARERFPAEHDAWAAGQDVPRGGGETYRAAAERARAAVEDGLRDVPASGLLLAVTHGGTARALLGALLEADPEQWWRFAPLGNVRCSVLVEHARGWRLEQHNSAPDGLGGAVPATPLPAAGPVR